MCRAAPLAAPPRSRRGAKIRVGIVSGFFRDHTVWTLLIHGWLTQLDRERFEVFGYHTGTRRDDRTLLAAQWCDRFADMLGPVAEWRARVLDDAPDVLLYPEIGMDPVAAGLAAQRLAPVQCVAWGHPVTSGLPSIDYFLSGALMEPDAGPSHYTETLVRLPNLGAYVEPDAPPPPTLKRRCEFGLREGAAVFWSGQNLPKYHPRHDGVFARIAQAVPDSQFVFIAYGHGTAATEAFAARLAAAFSTFGLDALRHCVILPQMAQADFLAAASLCDIVLDTIGWSGGRSTLDLLAIDPVVVTLPGRFLRGRHTAAILRMIGATETVADSVDGYVDLAVRLAQQPAFRARVRGDVAARKHRVARDRAAIDALEGFLASVAANQPPRESSETPP
jgi:predicted O-linked N-acetylglucosamine transferase (SPINDLY family)